MPKHNKSNPRNQTNNTSWLDKAFYLTAGCLIIFVFFIHPNMKASNLSTSTRATPDCTEVELRLQQEVIDASKKGLEAETRLLDVEKRLVEADKKLIAIKTDPTTTTAELSSSTLDANKAEVEAEERAVAFEKRAVEAETKILELEKSIKATTALRGSGRAGLEPGSSLSASSSGDKWGSGAGAPFPTPSHSKAVRCNSVKINTPMRVTGMQSIGKKYMVSYSWWGHRGSIKKYGTNAARTYKQMQQPIGNDSIRNVQELINKSPPGSAFLDIGANVGFMTFYAPVTGRPVYAFDPIQYDISKLCEGLLGNIWSETFSWEMAKEVNIFHAAVGPENKDNVKITRPSDEIGYFDQASLSASAVNKPASQKVTENVPMMRMDDIVPDNVRPKLFFSSL